MWVTARPSRQSPTSICRRFGGYDPLGVARGVAVAGNPNVWFIAGARLFLFYDRTQQEKFAADPDRLAATAQRKWPDVLKTLSQ